MSELNPNNASLSKSQRAWSWLRTYGRGIPLVGPLFTCTARNHVDSLKEFLISIAFGTATFTVTAIFLKALLANATSSYFQLLMRTIDSGQLFIFAVGMLGPILLTSAEDPASSKTFPSRTVHLAILILIAVLASGFYALVLIGRDPLALGLINTRFLFTTSVVVAALVVVMRYLTIVYRRSTADFVAERDMPKQAQEFVGDFAQRHGGRTS